MKPEGGVGLKARAMGKMTLFLDPKGRITLAMQQEGRAAYLARQGVGARLR